MRSAGLVPYRETSELEILIAHPGGPFWARRQTGAWSIVKGEVGDGEEPFDAARREFREETGWDPPSAGYIALGEVTQKAGKVISAWAFAADLDPESFRPEMTTITIDGRPLVIPEIDEVRWCGRDESQDLLNPAQTVYYERLKSALAGER